MHWTQQGSTIMFSNTMTKSFPKLCILITESHEHYVLYYLHMYVCSLANLLCMWLPLGKAPEILHFHLHVPLDEFFQELRACSSGWWHALPHMHTCPANKNTTCVNMHPRNVSETNWSGQQSSNVPAVESWEVHDMHTQKFCWIHTQPISAKTICLKIDWIETIS